MGSNLKKHEKETSYLYNQSMDPGIISTYDPPLMRRLAKFAEAYPELCQRIDDGSDQYHAEYRIEKRAVSIRLLPPCSEERRKAAAERASRMFHSEKEK